MPSGERRHFDHHITLLACTTRVTHIYTQTHSLTLPHIQSPGEPDNALTFRMNKAG